MLLHGAHVARVEDGGHGQSDPRDGTFEVHWSASEDLALLR